MMSLKCFFIIWYCTINHQLKSGVLLRRRCKRGNKRRIELARVSRRGRRAGGENPDTQAKLNNTFRYAILLTIITTHLEHNKAEMHWTLNHGVCKNPKSLLLDSSCSYLWTLMIRLWMISDTETVIQALIYRKSTTGNSLGAATRLMSSFERKELLSR